MTLEALLFLRRLYCQCNNILKIIIGFFTPSHLAPCRQAVVGHISVVCQFMFMYCTWCTWCIMFHQWSHANLPPSPFGYSQGSCPATQRIRTSHCCPRSLDQHLCRYAQISHCRRATWSRFRSEEAEQK